ncbi:DUF6597 domain-containing transcriptional factor [Paenibacillus hexagrammi]|uniref:DUF6597 domain-containing transcriptional factor n=1 Tax=Paenibacillus hexagrammi TaxID=2908839 RepID=UPI0033130927
MDSILVQEDFNPSNYANRNPVKVLPSTLAVIGIQYGQRMRCIGEQGAELLGSSGITGLQTSSKQYVSTGSIGTIIITFKPGGLKSFTPYPIHEFQDANVDLDLVFPIFIISIRANGSLYANPGGGQAYSAFKGGCVRGTARKQVICQQADIRTKIQRGNRNWAKEVRQHCSISACDSASKIRSRLF